MILLNKVPNILSQAGCLRYIGSRNVLIGGDGFAFNDLRVGGDGLALVQIYVKVLTFLTNYFLFRVKLDHHLGQEKRFRMSVSRLFTIVGDLNIKRNMTGLNVASREAMKSAQIIDCVSMSTLDDALNEVRKESAVLVIAAFTEFLLSGGDCGTIASSIDPILAELSTKIKGFCSFRPDLKVRFMSFIILTAFK